MIIKFGISGNLLIVSSRVGTNGNKHNSIRGAVDSFSATSGRRMRKYLRECISDYKYMHTLTYPRNFPTDGRQYKEHLRQYCQAIKRYLHKQYPDCTLELFSMFWFVEFQKRGAPHFHIFTTHRVPYDFCAKKWYELCKTGDKNHFYAGTRIESIRSGRAGTISYASKYAAKSEQKNIPEFIKNPGRFWGIYGNRECVSATTNTSDNDGQFCINLSLNLISTINIYEQSEKIKNIFNNETGFAEYADSCQKTGVWVYAIQDNQTMLEIAREIAILDRAVTLSREIRYRNAFILLEDDFQATNDDTYGGWDFWQLREMLKEGFI